MTPITSTYRKFSQTRNILAILMVTLLCSTWPESFIHAEGATTLTPTTGAGSLGTNVTPPGIPHEHIFQITGGTRSDHGTGTNLFHRFNEFSIGQADTAQFLNTTPHIQTENILVQVIGGARSMISGTIDTMSYPSANLFLMNPSGIVFGQNATLHVGGTVAFTTADYLRFAKADGSQAGIFDAHSTVDKLLTSAPVAAFGFVNHEQAATPAAIAVQGSILEVQAGKSLSLVGGNITIESGMLGNREQPPPSALGKQLLMASVASSGEVLAGTLDRAPNIIGQTSSELGTVQISKQSLIDARGEGGGGIHIMGGQLVVDDSTLVSTTGRILLDATSVKLTGKDAGVGTETGTSSSAGDVSLNAADDITVDSGAIVGSFSSSSGRAGNVTLNSSQGNIQLTNNSLVTSQTSSGAGNTGRITIVSALGDIILDNAHVFTFAQGGTGTAGGIQISGHNLLLQKQSSIEGNNFSIGPAEDIAITLAGRLSLTGDSTITTTTPGSQKAADIFVRSKEILISGNSTINTSTLSSGDAGRLSLSTDSLQLTDGGRLLSESHVSPGGEIPRGHGGIISVEGYRNPGASIAIEGPASGIFTDTEGSGHGGTIDLSVQSLMLRNGGTLSAVTSGPVHSATGGSITVRATDRVTMTNGASITASTSGPGDAGDIVIKAKDVSITGEAKITAESKGSGRAGTVTIQGFTSPAHSFLLDGVGSNILTSTAQTGAGGNILIHAKDVMFRNGGKVSAETFGASSSATGGTIDIQGDRVRIESGALVTSSTSGAAKGGAITVTARESVSINDGAAISASSTGLGDAGNISIHAGQRFTNHNGFVTTSAKQSSGGDIDIRASDLVSLINGRISTSVLGGTGNGGNIFIDPNMVVLQNNSQIVANAIAGHGGNIAITTPLFLADQSSLVDASSLFGLNGTVTIQSPISNLSGTVGQLTSQPSPVHLLVQNRCVALANGQPSTLIVGGRQTFSTTLGGWVSSPTQMELATGELLGVRGEEWRLKIPVGSENEMLSLRRLTPPSFLVRSFATDVHTGCRL